MLAPNVSLAKLCKTVGLEHVSKGIFPHDLVRGDNPAFLDEPELPARAEDWFNRLNRSAPSQAEVDAARAEFNRLGLTSVREYLLHYLHADLEVLLLSVDRLFAKLEEIVGIHPVSVRKFSLSGFSFLAAQYQLVREHRPGCFTCNHAAMFSSLKRAMRGGVTMVCRTVAGHDLAGGNGMAAPNAHILLPDDGEGAPPHPDPLRRADVERLYTLYYDQVSQYPTSGESRSPPPSPRGLRPLVPPPPAAPWRRGEGDERPPRGPPRGLCAVRPAPHGGRWRRSPRPL